jgi:hypothetical protein
MNGATHHKGSATFTIKSNNSVSFTVSDVETGQGFVQTYAATSKDMSLTSESPATWFYYLAPISFNVLQTANIKRVLTPLNITTDSTGILYDPTDTNEYTVSLRLMY